MENVASNTGMTADVLREVIRRQDETKQRMDIRKVMHATFDRAFAIAYHNLDIYENYAVYEAS